MMGTKKPPLRRGGFSLIKRAFEGRLPSVAGTEGKADSGGRTVGAAEPWRFSIIDGAAIDAEGLRRGGERPLVGQAVVGSERAAAREFPVGVGVATFGLEAQQARIEIDVGGHFLTDEADRGADTEGQLVGHGEAVAVVEKQGDLLYFVVHIEDACGGRVRTLPLREAGGEGKFMLLVEEDASGEGGTQLEAFGLKAGGIIAGVGVGEFGAGERRVIGGVGRDRRSGGDEGRKSGGSDELSIHGW